MKLTFFSVFILLTTFSGSLFSYGQTTGSITVAGDFNKFYPVTFSDGGWVINAASELELARSQVHENTSWRGSLMAKFEYHTTRWGNGARFINADVIQNANGDQQNVEFIAGWRDATLGNSDDKIIIWLRGGGTTYYYRSKYALSVAVYDGVANSLPFLELNGPTHDFKTAVDLYVNSYGISREGTAYFHANANNYFAGNVGIGTIDPKGYKLAVAGNMIAESVKVKLLGTWPDYVFADDYKLPTLKETEQHIKEKGHLPNIPSAEEVKANGIDLGEMNAKLLQKIEELTLYLIDMKKESEKERENNLNQQVLIEQQQKDIKYLQSKFK